jgi:hypothetical protein
MSTTISIRLHPKSSISRRMRPYLKPRTRLHHSIRTIDRSPRHCRSHIPAKRLNILTSPRKRKRVDTRRRLPLGIRMTQYRTSDIVRLSEASLARRETSEVDTAGESVGATRSNHRHRAGSVSRFKRYKTNSSRAGGSMRRGQEMNRTSHLHLSAQRQPR